MRNAGPTQSFLLVAGQREYEDVAVELMSTSHGQKVLKRIRLSLRDGRKRDLRLSRLENMEHAADGDTHEVGAGERHESLAIFDTEAITSDLDRAFMLMSDVHDTWTDGVEGAGKQREVRLPHIVLSGRNLDDDRP